VKADDGPANMGAGPARAPAVVQQANWLPALVEQTGGGERRNRERLGLRPQRRAMEGGDIRQPTQFDLPAAVDRKRLPTSRCP
jgi:hypothetical protein